MLTVLNKSQINNIHLYILFNLHLLNRKSLFEISVYTKKEITLVNRCLCLIWVVTLVMIEIWCSKEQLITVITLKKMWLNKTKIRIKHFYIHIRIDLAFTLYIGITENKVQRSFQSRQWIQGNWIYLKCVFNA